MTALAFVNEVARMMGYPQVTTIEGTISTETADTLQATNVVLGHLQGDKDWHELTTDAHISMVVSSENEGTVSVTYGSSTLTAPLATFVAADVGKLVMLSETKTAYRITAYVASNQVTIDRPWVESSISGVTHTVYVGQDSYDMPTDFDRLLVDKLYNPVEDDYVSLVDPNELAILRQANGLGLNIGQPAAFTIHGLNTAGTSRVAHFDVCPENNYDLEFQYQKKHPTMDEDTDKILYPDKEKLYILDMVVGRLNRDAEAMRQAGQVANDAMFERNKAQQRQENGTAPLRIVPASLAHGRRRRR